MQIVNREVSFEQFFEIAICKFNDLQRYHYNDIPREARDKEMGSKMERSEVKHYLVYYDMDKWLGVQKIDVFGIWKVD